MQPACGPLLNHSYPLVGQSVSPLEPVTLAFLHIEGPSEQKALIFFLFFFWIGLEVPSGVYLAVWVSMHIIFWHKQDRLPESLGFLERGPLRSDFTALLSWGAWILLYILCFE